MHARRFTVTEHRKLAQWAAACAKRVLPLFEKVHPEDFRPREAIAAVRLWLCGKVSVGEARRAAFAAHAAARKAKHPAAVAAARACGQAAGVAHVPGHAKHAAKYALKAAGDGQTEQARQKRHLPHTLRRKIFPADNRPR